MGEGAGVCCFTGHRCERIPWLEEPKDPRTAALEEQLWTQICASYAVGYKTYLCGMAQGVDLLCAKLVLRLGLEDPGVKLFPVIPFPGQASRWPYRDQRNYETVLRSCGNPPVVVAPFYHRACFYERNRYMVDRSQRMIAVFDGSPKGGTYQTLEYARGKGLETVIVVP